MTQKERNESNILKKINREGESIIFLYDEIYILCFWTLKLNNSNLGIILKCWEMQSIYVQYKQQQQ